MLRCAHAFKSHYIFSWKFHKSLSKPHLNSHEYLPNILYQVFSFHLFNMDTLIDPHKFALLLWSQHLLQALHFQTRLWIHRLSSAPIQAPHSSSGHTSTPQCGPFVSFLWIRCSPRPHILHYPGARRGTWRKAIWHQGRSRKRHHIYSKAFRLARLGATSGTSHYAVRPGAHNLPEYFYYLHLHIQIPLLSVQDCTGCTVA